MVNAIKVQCECPEWAEPNQCGINVERMIEEQGGDVVHGWAFRDKHGLWIEQYHHVVWRRPDGELRDVTPMRLITLGDNGTITESWKRIEKEIDFRPDPE